MGILLQHSLVRFVYERLWERGIHALCRRGNDIYIDEKKLNVSIVTRSNVSVLIHVGINIETAGTPVPTSGLAQLEISPLLFAEEILEGFKAELQIYKKARVKVSPR